MIQGTRRVWPLLALLLLAGCATNPVTGQREIILMSTGEEARVGQEAARQVAEEIGFVANPALQAYVAEVGGRVARGALRPDVQYQFSVVEMQEPNAFALPGGYIYVSRGLLEITNSEAELANVLAHEIAHVDARHAAQRQTRAAGVGILAVLVAVLAGAAGGGETTGSAGQLAELAGAGAIASYSRDQEREADRVGQNLAARTGYDPAAMTSFLQTLENVARLETGASRRPGFLDSHPSTPERVAGSAARAAGLETQPRHPMAATREAFYLRLDGMVIGQDPAEGLLRGDRFLHPDLGLTMRFPEGWTIQNSRTAVAALAPRHDATLALELQQPGADPRVAAGAFLQMQGLPVLESDALRIAGLLAFRALSTSQDGNTPLALDLTWIAYGGRIYRITGLTSTERYPAYDSAFAGAGRSFRPLRDDELAEIEVLRLRAIQAREGESLDALSQRTRNAWSPLETAVANGRSAQVRLQEGEWIKIALGEPYRPVGAVLQAY